MLLTLLCSLALLVPGEFPLVRAGEPFPCGSVLPCGVEVAGPAPRVCDGKNDVLPVPGLYEAGGRRAIALADDPVTNARSAFLLAATAAQHGAADNDAFHADEAAVTARLFGDGAALYCGQTAMAMGVLLDEMDVEHRLVQWVGEGGAFVAHQTLEARLPEGWTLFDPWLGLGFAPGVSALDVFDAARAERPLGPLIATYVHKPYGWLGDSLDFYWHMDSAVGVFVGEEGNRSVVLVEAVDGWVREHEAATLGVWPWREVTRDEMAATLY